MQAGHQRVQGTNKEFYIMTTSEVFIVSGGALSFLMVIFHLFFFRLFHWKDEFDKLQTANRRIFMTIHIALILLFVIFAFLSFSYYRVMAGCEGMAFGLVICYALFWLWRVLWQIFYFRIPPSVKKTPVMHIVTIIAFGLLFVCYAIPVMVKLAG
jgi:cytochrome b561